jgi:hypothetical protein
LENPDFIASTKLIAASPFYSAAKRYQIGAACEGLFGCSAGGIAGGLRGAGGGR